MRIIKQITDNKFLNIKEVFDDVKYCHGYQFAERRGKDSIAFIGWDIEQEHKDAPFLLNCEFTPPTNEFLYRAFGGSLDKAKDKIEIVIEEVREECGYEITARRVAELGNMFVSTQMNQRCYLYFVNLTGAKSVGRKPENKIEAMATLSYRTKQQILDGDDWKAIVILTKMANKDSWLSKADAGY